MMNGIEQEHCRKMLELLTTPDLISLTDTVTKNAIIPVDRNEAISIIIEYSQTMKELLQRRKMKRLLIFTYLHNEGFRVQSSSDKDFLIHTVISNITRLTSMNQSQLSVEDYNANQNDGASSYSYQVENPIIKTDQQLSHEFVGWFYPMLNSLCSDATRSDAPGWNVDHFWPDCKLNCTFPVSPSCDDIRQETHQSAENVYKRLTSLVKDERIIFNVNNTPSGHRGRINSYGMAKVAACGTIHRAHEQINNFGIFEQMFGLMRDPTDKNNWKIKFTDLTIKFSSNTSPTLSEDSQLQIFQE